MYTSVSRSGFYVDGEGTEGLLIVTNVVWRADQYDFCFCIVKL